MRRSLTLDRLLHTAAPHPTVRATIQRALQTGQWQDLSWFRQDEAPVPALAPGFVALGRYVIEARIGAGSFGAVYRARDALTEDVVAVKVLSVATPGERALMEREVDTLRVLHLPGVVPYLDHGEIGDSMLLAMGWVDGRPFPESQATPWEALAKPFVGLIESLARVHANGVIHRDLKPANVLLQADGRPIVLDFGIARRERLGCRIADDGQMSGTPGYLAPEQLFGGTPDARTDVYALGTMLYEGLTGRLPFEGDTLTDILEAKLKGRPEPLPESVPEAVRELVDAMLSPAAERRPAHMSALLHVLRRHLPEGDALPWVGSRQLIDHVVQELTAGRSVRVRAPRGRGRTRLVHEVAQALRAAGTDPWVLADDGTPTRLMRALPQTGSLDAMLAAARTLLQALGAGGRPVLVDATESLAAGSQRVLAASCPDVPMLLVGAEEPPDVCLEPLDRSTLRAHFTGPDRFHHLRTDAAQALWQRTAGEPAAVHAELGSWHRAGLATRTPHGWLVPRNALSLIEAGMVTDPAPPHTEDESRLTRDARALLPWLGLAHVPLRAEALAEAAGMEDWHLATVAEELARVGLARWEDDRLLPTHAIPCDASVSEMLEMRTALAQALAPTERGRLALLVALGDIAGAVDEAIATARQALSEGDLTASWGACETGLALARRVTETARRRAIVVAAADTALTAARRSWVAEVAHHARALQHPDVADLLDLAPRSLSADGTVATTLYALAPFEDVTLTRWVHAMAMFALGTSPSMERRRLLARIEADPRMQEHPEFETLRDGWRAQVAESEGRFEDAVALRERAASMTRSAPSRVSMLVNATLRALDAGRPEDALRLARMAQEALGARRMPLMEAHLTAWERAAHYRSGHAPPEDPDALDPAEYEQMPHLISTVLLTTAAHAWRSGDPDRADFLADLALAHAHRPDLALLLQGLLGLIRGRLAPQVAAELWSEAGRATYPGVALQFAALACLGGHRRPEANLVARRATEIPADLHAVRREVLSVTECLAALGGVHPTPHVVPDDRPRS